MKKINEIFCSIQGEGYHTGTPAIFIRFSGCNLRCPFCDTKHEEGQRMSDEEIIEKIKDYKPSLVVLTGGEPSLFIDESFVEKLHAIGKYVAIETNGTHKVPSNIDWITCSPKSDFCDKADVVVERCDELKVVYTYQNIDKWLDIEALYYYLQPCDTKDEQKNKEMISSVVEKCIDNPKWRISLQTQKILNVR